MAVAMARSWKLGVPRQDGGALAGLRAGFAAELERQGYSGRTAGQYLTRFDQLSCWMQAQGLGAADCSPLVVRQFHAACRAAGCRHHVSIRGAKPMLAYLRAAGVCDAQEAPLVDPVDALLEQFAGWLARERQLAPRSVAAYVVRARPLVERLAIEDGIAMELLTAALIRRFVVDVCPRQAQATAKLTVVAIRQLLAYLFASGALERPLAGAVPSVARARPSGLPKRLDQEQVAQMLDACDRHTPVGRRDFAIVTLLARLGIRSGEAASLRLDDIDWRAGEITVCGKGRCQQLPLRDGVGEALAEYLRHGRRADARSRAMFLTTTPPARGMSPGAVREAVGRVSSRAGLGRVNAHRLRHTLAIEMLAAGADLPSIGQVLGHRTLETTAVYAKCDRGTLRLIARPWPGAVA